MNNTRTNERRRISWLAAAEVALLVSLAMSSSAYQAPATPNETLKSPDLDSQGLVTFRLYAPNARIVQLKASGAEATPGLTSQEMQKSMAGYPMVLGDQGVWAVTIGPIQPGVYRYTFIVDGVQTTDPRNPVASESLNMVQSMYDVPGASFMEYKPEVPHGAIASVWYQSKAVGNLRRMHIYTPPGYEHGDSRYPVLYLLHGGGDTDDSWPTVGRAGAILDNLLAAHQAMPMIVVMPAGHISRGFQLSAGLNTMGHDKFNDDLTGSVIPYVDKTYRTTADREHRALAGLSMGGLQTLTISLTNSDLFSYVGVFSSGWFAQTRDLEEKTDLTQYKTSGHPFKRYWVGVGKLDIANANSAATVELLKKYGVSPVTHESDGFHAWNNWRDYLHVFAPQLFH